MKIILIYPDDLGKEIEEIIIDSLTDKMTDSLISSPLKYADKMEVER